MDKLGINAGYLLVQVVGFSLLTLLLWGLLYKPLVDMLEARKEKIADGINKARRAEEALASAEADRQKILDEARAEAQKIISESRSRADDAAVQVKAAAEQEAKRIREQATAEAGGERDRLLADMRDQIISLSMAAAYQLVGASLDEKKQKQVVTDFFSAVPEGAKGLGDSFTVVTAIPLTDAEQKKFTKALGTDAVTFQTDPGILGGVIVRAGGQQMDNSFATQLAEMRVSLS